MWESIARARRRLRRDGSTSDANAAHPDDDAGDDQGSTDITFALGRAIETVAGTGVPSVTRRPAGVYTPETWQIEIAQADGRTRAALEGAIRGGGSL